MARISDIIAQFINSMIDEEEKNEVIIQRNELAEKFNCAPSQINYVLTTRFTFEKGYIIESRRGGGGYIVIKKVEYYNEAKRLRMLYDVIGDSITYNSALSIIEHLYEVGIITRKECDLIKITLNERTLVSVEDKNKVRADMLRGMITVILS